jgi:hypothetical protein
MSESREDFDDALECLSGCVSYLLADIDPVPVLIAMCAVLDSVIEITPQEMIPPSVNELRRYVKLTLQYGLAALSVVDSMPPEERAAALDDARENPR